jgi:hypothetical protein
VLTAAIVVESLLLLTADIVPLLLPLLLLPAPLLLLSAPLLLLLLLLAVEKSTRCRGLPPNVRSISARTSVLLTAAIAAVMLFTASLLLLLSVNRFCHESGQ